MNLLERAKTHIDRTTETDQELEDLNNCIQFEQVFIRLQNEEIAFLKDSGLKLDFTHHWAWNSDTQEIEYAPRLKKYDRGTPTRKAPCCLNCGANPKKLEYRILSKVKI